MSLSSLANQQVDRSSREVVPLDAAAKPSAGTRDDQFDQLVKYIPTEVITLFVAAMAAAKPIHDTFGLDPWGLYWLGGLLTPVTLLLITYAKLRNADVVARFRPHPWPVVASFLAYLAWAVSVPGLLTDNSTKVLAAFGAVFISFILGLAERVVGPRSPAPAGS